MITALAHTAICVPDLDAALEWYGSVLGLTVIAGPALMEGEALERDMGDLVPGVVLKAAILGFESGGDNVLEVIEYPKVSGRPRAPGAGITDYGVSHIGLVCDDIERTRAEIEAKGVEFFTRGIADIAGHRTSWFNDREGIVSILMQKCAAYSPYFWHV